MGFGVNFVWGLDLYLLLWEFYGSEVGFIWLVYLKILSYVLFMEYNNYVRKCFVSICG